MKSRVAVLVLFFASLFLVVLGRMFYIQVIPNGPLEKLRTPDPIYDDDFSSLSTGKRFLIRRGEELATSVTAQSLYADPGLLVRSPHKLAKKLASLLRAQCPRGLWAAFF